MAGIDPNKANVDNGGMDPSKEIAERDAAGPMKKIYKVDTKVNGYYKHHEYGNVSEVVNLIKDVRDGDNINVDTLTVAEDYVCKNV